MSKQLIDATNELATAIIKFTEAANILITDKIIHANNDAEKIGSSATLVSQTVHQVETNLSGMELDDEGRPWIEGLHTNTKTKTSSPEVRGGQKWRFVRGTSDEQKEEYHKKYPLNIGGEADTPEVEETVTKITPPPGMNAASLPPNSTPGKALPPSNDDKSAELRDKITSLVQSLVEIGVTWDDLKELFSEELGTSQNGEQITLGSVPKSEYQGIFDYLSVLVGQYEQIRNDIKRLYEIAGSEHKRIVDSNVIGFYNHYNAKDLSGVHYSNIPELASNVAEMRDQWEEWAKSNG